MTDILSILFNLLFNKSPVYFLNLMTFQFQEGIIALIFFFLKN